MAFQGHLFHDQVRWYDSTEVCNHGHLTFSYFPLLCVSGDGGQVHQGSYVPARLKVPSEQVILCWECVIMESNLSNLPFLSQFDNYNFISKSQIQDLRASFHSSSLRPHTENSHKSTFKKNPNHSDEQWQMIWKHLKFSVAGRKLPTLPTGFVGNRCKIEAEHAQINTDTKIKAMVHFN